MNEFDRRKRDGYTPAKAGRKIERREGGEEDETVGFLSQRGGMVGAGLGGGTGGGTGGGDIEMN